ncbi:hypothetical protein CLJ1_2786 [Pseudomonas paraeruginosa]|nr:hypothetical protein CLJ1_2786 [Pseudomonas aeruginosa]
MRRYAGKPFVSAIFKAFGINGLENSEKEGFPSLSAESLWGWVVEGFWV